eukprot:366384-Chlamydomonas_euryale.AAC.10
MSGCAAASGNATAVHPWYKRCASDGYHYKPHVILTKEDLEDGLLPEQSLRAAGSSRVGGRMGVTRESLASGWGGCTVSRKRHTGAGQGKSIWRHALRLRSCKAAGSQGELRASGIPPRVAAVAIENVCATCVEAAAASAASAAAA